MDQFLGVSNHITFLENVMCLETQTLHIATGGVEGLGLDLWIGLG
jgi:hypothetical protein